MRRPVLAVLAVLAGAGLAGAEAPPYKRILQGDDAKRVAALQDQIDKLWDAGKFAEGVAPAEEVLALRRRVQGEGHWETASAARVVARLREAAALPADKQAILKENQQTIQQASALQQRARYAEAEPLFRKALAVHEEVLGPRHSETAESCASLAANLHEQGRLKEAEPLVRRALAISEEVQGRKHPILASRANNLGYNLQAQGRAREAEALFRQALALWEEVLGPRDLRTALGYNNVAYILQLQGESLQAEPLYHRALAIYEEVLGPRHPDTARSYDNLAGTLHMQGRFQEADPLFRQALAVRAEVMGPKHPLTALSASNLAANLGAQGRPREAEALYRRALAVREEVFGAKHPATALSCNNLAVELFKRERFEEAEALLRRALAIDEEVLGAGHAWTLQHADNLANTLHSRGQAPEAETLHRKALAAAEEVLGRKHILTIRLRNNLAMDLTALARFKDAEPLFRQALEISEEVLGRRHPETAIAFANLARNCTARGQDREAEPLWQAAADALEAARSRLAASSFDRAAAVRIDPHLCLAACRARQGKPVDAWTAAEAGLARGLLDDLAARAGLPPDPAADARDRRRAARLDALDRFLTPLLAAQKLNDEGRRRRDDLLAERSALDDEAARAAALSSRQAVASLAAVQAALPPDAALVFWVDDPQSSEHWGCVLRHSGPPAWERLTGTGSSGAWTKTDDELPRRLREDLARGEAAVPRRARLLAEQRLGPLARHLAAGTDVPAVQQLFVVPVGPMAGVPVEVLSERYRVSYAPSGSVLARLRARPRALESPTLLALGDPNFALPGEGASPEPPDHGLYLWAVLPGGAAAGAGLRAGDVLLRYGDTRLTSKADFKPASVGEPVPIVVWREGKTSNDRRLATGPLGMVVADDPPAVAIGKRRELALLGDSRSRSGLRPLPGTRLEVAGLAALLPREKVTVLLGSRASEQELASLAAADKLKEYRLIHLATHGTIDPLSAAHSAVELARDGLPGPAEQDRLRAAGRKVPTGRLSAGDVAAWNLEADLVALSACETALGPEGGGEGLLGFSQVLLGRGARTLLLSLWKVDDTATALLMTRFYQNLLGKREGLQEALPKAEALREAKQWLRALSRAEVEKRAGELTRSVVRAAEEPAGQILPALPAGEAPFAHPRFWAAFILIGDPE